MSVSDPLKKLHAFIERITPPSSTAAELSAFVSGSTLPHHAPDPIVAELVRSFFIWEAGTLVAHRELDAVHASLADYNELRVCFPHDLARIIESRDPHFEQRALRLRSTLNDIYRREHEISLLHLTTLSKRDARAYLDSLEGTPPFVAARVALLALHAHAIPIDERLARVLLAERALPSDAETTSLSPIASWLEHQIRADDAKLVYMHLEQWADQHPAAPSNPQPAPRANKRVSKPATSSSTQAPVGSSITSPTHQSAPSVSSQDEARPAKPKSSKPASKGSSKAQPAHATSAAKPSSKLGGKPSSKTRSKPINGSDDRSSGDSAPDAKPPKATGQRKR